MRLLTWLELLPWLDGAGTDCSVVRDGVIGGVMELPFTVEPGTAACA